MKKCGEKIQEGVKLLAYYTVGLVSVVRDKILMLGKNVDITL